MKMLTVSPNQPCAVSRTRMVTTRIRMRRSSGDRRASIPETSLVHAPRRMPNAGSRLRGSGYDRDPVTKNPKLWPVAACFAWLGLFWGGWAVATLDIERFLCLGIAGFGAVISVVVGAGVGANLMAGPLVERWGTGPILACAIGVSGILIFILTLMRSPLAF